MIKRGRLIQLMARSAGRVVRKAAPTDGVIQKAGRANIVTAADFASERYIIETIQKDYPRDVIFSEETEISFENILELENVWIIDPIDGTNNLRYQRNYSCVSIGYVEKGIIKFAAVYDPFRDELFFAEQGKGAYLNEMKITVGNGSDISQMTIATDNSYKPKGTRYNIEQLLRFPRMPWVLMKGSAVLTMCEVAAGRIDLYFHSAVKPWDNAAAFLTVYEAGGIITDFKGKDVNFLSPNIVVGNQKLVNQFVAAIK